MPPSTVPTSQRWIVCVLDFKGRKRPLMQPGLYTELFFLDEATALAVDARENQARIAADTGATVDLGDHEDVALALALAVWYGEASRDSLPQTDQADEANTKRTNRHNGRR